MIITTVAQTYPYSIYKTGEKEANKTATILRAFMQEKMVRSAVGRIYELGRVSNKIPPLSSRSISISTWTPYVLVPFIMYKDKLPSEHLRTMLQLIHDNLGTVASVASLVSAVALIYFGQVFIGGLTLAFMALGELRDRGYFSGRLAFGADTLGSLASLYGATGGLRILILLNLITTLLEPYLYSGQNGSDRTTFVSTDISNIPVDASDLWDRLQINEAHFFYPIPSDENDPCTSILQMLHALRKEKLEKFINDFCKSWGNLLDEIKEKMPAYSGSLVSIKEKINEQLNKIKPIMHAVLEPEFGLTQEKAPQICMPVMQKLNVYIFKKAFYCEFSKVEVVAKAYRELIKHGDAPQVYKDWCTAKQFTDPGKWSRYLWIYLIENNILKYV
jgi:hypothetical protein